MKISLGRIFGIAVDIDYTWLLILGLVAYSATMGYFHKLYPEMPHLRHWGLGIVAALLFFATLLGHELAHSVVAKRRGIGIEGITLFVFGGVSRMKGEPASAGDELKMAIAGPAFSFVSAIVFWLIAAAAQGTTIAAICSYVAALNLVIGVFNLIPGFPLDGGRVLRAIIWKYTGNLLYSTKIASTVGQVFGWLLVVLGFIQLQMGAGIGGLWMIVIGWFLAGAAGSAYRQTEVEQTLSGLKISDVMISPPPAVSASDTLEDAVASVVAASDHAMFPVIDESGMIGVLRLQDAYNIPREKWGQTLVREASKPVDVSSLPAPEDQALGHLQTLGEDEMVIVVRKRVPIGVVTRNSLMRIAQYRHMAR